MILSVYNQKDYVWVYIQDVWSIFRRHRPWTSVVVAAGTTKHCLCQEGEGLGHHNEVRKSNCGQIAGGYRSRVGQTRVSAARSVTSTGIEYVLCTPVDLRRTARNQ